MKESTHKASVDDSYAAVDELFTIPRTDLVEPTGPNDPKMMRNVNYVNVRGVIEGRADIINDSKAQLEILPDLQIVRANLNANIFDPKDLGAYKLTVTVGDDYPPEAPEVARKYFTSVFNLEEKLPKGVDTALFIEGAAPFIPLPINSIKTIIKNEAIMESINSALEYDRSSHIALENYGLLNVKRKKKEYALALESYIEQNKDVDVSELQPFKIEKNTALVNESLIQLVDNPGYLLLPYITSVKEYTEEDEIIKRAYGFEDFTSTPPSLDEVIYKKASNVFKEVITVRDNGEVNEDVEPIVLTPPAEAVVPIFFDDPSKPVGYYIALEEDGTFLKLKKDSNAYKQMNDRLNDALRINTMGSVNLLNGTFPSVGAQYAQNLQRPFIEAYKQQFEQVLRDAQKKGNKNNLQIAAPDEFYKVMLYRQLCNSRTKVLYVPASLCTYMAFEYNEAGFGISLLEKTKMIASFRTVMMFATLMAALKSAVNSKKMSITLDPNEPDPQGAIELFLNEYMAGISTLGFPVGLINPVDVMNGIQRSGINIAIDGGDVYPETKVEVTENKNDITPPNTDIVDMLKILHYTALYTTPTQIDSTLESEYMGGITSTNLSAAKRDQHLQDIAINHGSDLMHKVLLAGGSGYKELKELWDKWGDKKGRTLRDMILSLKLTLPAPDVSKVASQKQHFEDLSLFLDEFSKVYISDEMIKDMLDKESLNTAPEVVRQQVINVFKRQWAHKNNILPEFTSMFLTDSDSKLSDDINEWNKNVIELFGDVIIELKKNQQKIDDKIQEEEAKLNPPIEDTISGGEGVDTMEGGEGSDEIPAEGGDTTGEEPTDDSGAVDETTLDDTGETSDETTPTDDNVDDTAETPEDDTETEEEPVDDTKSDTDK